MLCGYVAIWVGFVHIEARSVKGKEEHAHFDRVELAEQRQLSALSELETQPRLARWSDPLGDPLLSLSNQLVDVFEGGALGREHPQQLALDLDADAFAPVRAAVQFVRDRLTGNGRSAFRRLAAGHD